MNRKFILLFPLLLLFTNCEDAPKSKKADQNAVKEMNQVLNMDQQLKERGETLTKEMSRQKEIKSGIEGMPLIEAFKRTTIEKEVLAKLGEPQSVKDIKLQDFETKVYYYSNFAVWLWRHSITEKNKPFQYRATISLNDKQKFDLPLHNVFEEEELKITQDTFSEIDKIDAKVDLEDEKAGEAKQKTEKN